MLEHTSNARAHGEQSLLDDRSTPPYLDPKDAQFGIVPGSGPHSSPEPPAPTPAVEQQGTATELRRRRDTIIAAGLDGPERHLLTPTQANETQGE